MIENNIESLNRVICCIRVKYYPLLLICFFLLASDIVFVFCYCTEFSNKISKTGSVIVGTINNLITLIIFISIYMAYSTDAGTVPVELKFQLSDIARKYIKRRKEMQEKIETGEDPKTINISSDDEEMVVSHETEDLEKSTEESKSRNEDSSRNSETNNTHRDNSFLVKLDRFEKNKLKFRYCEECDNIRPPRTKHCEYCKKCILKYDHHCFYIANCIGFNNHKYFILMLFYITIGCIFESLCFIFGWSQRFYGGFRSSIFSMIIHIENLSVIMTTLSISMLFFMVILMAIKNTSISEANGIINIFDDNNNIF